MSAHRYLGVAFLMSGALAIAGALLPWLTLYAGFYQYSGTAGMYGRIVLGAGILIMAAGAMTLRARTLLPARAGLVLALLLLAFTAWLYAGLVEIIRRPESAMIVAAPGPGLVFVFASSLTMVVASTVYLSSRHDRDNANGEARGVTRLW